MHLDVEQHKLYNLLKYSKWDALILYLVKNLQTQREKNYQRVPHSEVRDDTSNQYDESGVDTAEESSINTQTTTKPQYIIILLGVSYLSADKIP